MNIDYQVIKSKRKSLAICVKLDGGVIIKAPFKVAKSDIERFIAKYSHWIDEKVAKINIASSYKHYYYLGQPYALKHDPAIAGIIFQENFLITNFMPEQIKAWYYQQARHLVLPFIAKYSQEFDLKCAAIKISAARKRWGSCSSNGTISFSYRIAMLPKRIIQYIVAHELAHLKQHNHSLAFWEYVRQLYPEYKIAHQWLKQHQYALAFSLV